MTIFDWFIEIPKDLKRESDIDRKNVGAIKTEIE